MEDNRLRDGQQISMLEYPDGSCEIATSSKEIVVAHEKGTSDMSLWFSVIEFKNTVKVNGAFVLRAVILEEENKDE